MTNPQGHSEKAEARKLAIVTPSLIGSAQRVDFARASLRELQDVLAACFPHIVVDDRPRCRGRFLGIVPGRLTRRLPNLAHYWDARKIYRLGRNVELLRGDGRSNVDALAKAVARAKDRGCSYVFIHLDDNAYCRALAPLVSASIAAMDSQPDLNLLRLSAYPILTAECDSDRGNLSLCKRVGDTICFDSVTLHPVRASGFTVWKAPWEATTADGRYWPIILWNAIYRIGFLEQLLLPKGVVGLQTLGAVEARYKENWVAEWKCMTGSFGFINMQFGGIERERNANWQDLIQFPNRPIL